MRIWFTKTKLKNRRLGRAHVLDVKLRSSKLRAARFRMAALGLSSCFALLFAAYALWSAGDWTLRRFVYENEAFVIREIDLQTDGVIAVEQLRRWAGVSLNQNLFAVDLPQVQRRLELIPFIQSASLERVFPSTLLVRIVEREPLAKIYLPRPRPGGGVDIQTMHVDPAGFVMLPLDPRHRAPSAPPEPEHYPTLVGVNLNEVQPGRRVESPQFQAALDFLLAFERSPMAGLVDIQRIDISAPEVLQVATGQGSQITFSVKDFDQQLRRWREVADSGQRLGKALATLDLAIPNNVPATWLDASDPVPPPAKPIKPTKRKHV